MTSTQPNQESADNSGTASPTVANQPTGEIPLALSKWMSEYEAKLAAKYDARIDAMAVTKKSFDDLIQAAKWLGAIASIFILGFAFFFGKNMSDVQSVAKNTANDAFSDAIRDKTEKYKSLQELMDGATKMSKSLEEMENSLSGYTLLKETAKSASGFDPLIAYYSIDKEIDQRAENTKRVERGEENVELSSTTMDPVFRQKAAVVFEKLVEAVRSDLKSGNKRISSNLLFNAAANASKIQMEFVALELLEAAFASDKLPSPELEARLIRQRLSLSRITRDEAFAAIQPVLARVNGFDVHLVCSEAFNIALHLSMPVDMAQLIVKSLKPELQNTSYSLLNSSRLLMMGSTQADWNLGEDWYRQGLVSLSNESPTARWVEHSYTEIASALRERPDFFETYRKELTAVIGIHKNPRDLVKKIGLGLASVLQEMGKLDQFIRVER